jgi:hypothetical protein
VALVLLRWLYGQCPVDANHGQQQNLLFYDAMRLTAYVRVCHWLARHYGEYGRGERVDGNESKPSKILPSFLKDVTKAE